ncbi:MAG: nuclear transport factor 2 family protein [Chloroflexi bacterium]|nr:nuclear transport factor 2 family protein [Chloroflexota bacterium]
MKTLFKDLAVFLLILVLGMTGCNAPATQSPPTQPPSTQPPASAATEVAAVNPLSDVVLKMAERMNAGDLEGSLGYFADDSVTYFVGMPPTGMEIYRGKEGLRPVWEECIGSHFKMEVQIVSVVGDVVNAKSKTWHDFTRQLGVAPNEFVETYVVKDGKIALYSSVLTEESLARFKPALAAVMPPEPTAAPSTDTPVSEINVIISDDTCSYDGTLVLKAGEVKVNVDATGEDKKAYGLTFFSLDPGKDIVDLMATTPLPSPPSWSKMLTLWEMSPGTSETNTLTAAEGPLYLVCWSKPPDLAIGNVGPFEVK